jgi:hypothetical protein
MESDEPIPPRPIRLLAASFYCGTAPFLGYLKSRKDNNYADLHYNQALCIHAILLAIVLLYSAVSVTLSLILVFRRDWYEGTALEPTALMVVRRAFLCWLVVWAFATWWAFRGSWRPFPLFGRLAKYRIVMLGSLAGHTALVIAAGVALAMTLQASTLTRGEGAPAQAYLLYDDMDLLPHWLFDLGFYPIAKVSIEKWGEDSVVVAPLTKQALASALTEGSFVFVLSHGTDAGLHTRHFKIRPEDAAPDGTGGGLQLVYLTGCDSGALAKEWEEAFAPAKVITFDRLSAWLEHIYWLLFQGADEVRALS